MKKALSFCLVMLMLFALVFCLNTFATTGHGNSAMPFIITGAENKAWYYQGNFYLESYNSTSFSQSYAKGERIDTSKPLDDGSDHVIEVTEIDVVNGEYVVIQDFGFWTGIDQDRVAPLKTSAPTARVVGGNLVIIGDGMQFVYGVAEKGATDNVLHTEEADSTIYVKGKFSSITGKVVPAGELTAAGSPLIVGDEDNPYPVVITSGSAQLSGHFESLEVKESAIVTITGDTRIDDSLTVKGTLNVPKDITLCVDSVSVKPKEELKFTSTAPWGILQQGTYAAAAGNWVLGGDVTVENAFCKLDAISEPLVLDQSPQTGDKEEDIAKKESYTLTVLDGTVKAVHGNIAAEGGKVKLLLAPVIDEVKDIHNVVYASGDFKSINFGTDKTLTVRAGKAISAFAEYNGADTKYGVTPDQNTVFDHFGGKLPVAPSEATPYTYSAVYGPWEIEATEGDVVNGAGADLNVTKDGVKVSGEFNSLNTNGHPVTLAENTVIKGGECEIIGNAKDPYDLTVEGGNVTVSGGLHKLTVKGGNVTDDAANALTIVSNATAIEVSGGTLTFQNKNTSINVDGSNNVIAANITDGEFFHLKGTIVAQGDASKSIYVTRTGKYHLGTENNTAAYDSKDTPMIRVYGDKSSCVYAQAGGEAWLHAGEISFESAKSYGIWVNNGGIVHVYPNDQYGSDITSTKALLYVHGDRKGTAAMWVDTLGIFDIRGRGALLEQPEEGTHALFIAKNANLTIDEPLAGGTFNGVVEYQNEDLAELIPYNHYLRFDGDAPVWGTTDGTFGICPTAALSSENALGSCNALYPQLYADPAYSDMFGELGNYYTVTDAEWELRWNMKNGEDYQIPAGMGWADVLFLDNNVYNAQTTKGSVYYPLWGIDHKQGDVNVTGTSCLYLAGRTLTYAGTNGAHKALSGIDTAYTAYDGDKYTVNVESTGKLTVTSAVKDAEGAAFTLKSYQIMEGSIFYEPATAGETAAICSSGELNLASGKIASFAGEATSGVLVKAGKAVFGLNEEDLSTSVLRILGGAVDNVVETSDPGKDPLSQAVKVLGGELTVNGASIGATDSDMDNRGGENGITVLGGTVTVNGGIITGNCTQGKGILTEGGKVTVHGGCIYGQYLASKNNLSVHVNGGAAVLNIDEAHKTFTNVAQAAEKTSKVHYLNNVRVSAGSLIVGADSEGGAVTPNTYLNGTLTAEGGRTVFYDGVVMGTTAVYGAETGTAFDTEFFVENGSFGLLTVANGGDNSSQYDFLTGGDGDFQNKVQIHGGTYYGIDVQNLKLKGKPNTVTNVVAAWTKAFDYDQDGNKDWAPFNHFAETVDTTRGADGFWAEVPALRSGVVQSGSVVGGTEGKAVVIRFAPDELPRWAKAGGEYVVPVNIWYGECPASLCGLFKCKGTDSTAEALVITKNATLELNGFGVFTDRDEALLQVKGAALTVNAGVYGSGAYANVIRNFSENAAGMGVDVTSGSLKLSGAASTYPTIGAATAVRSAGSVDLEQGILRADYTANDNAALSATAGNVHVGDAELKGNIAGALMSGGSLKIDGETAILSSLQIKGNADAEMTAGQVKGTTLVDTSKTFAVSGTAELKDLMTQKSGIVTFDAKAADVLQNGGTMYVNVGELNNMQMSGSVIMNGGKIQGTLTQKDGNLTLKDGTVTAFAQDAGTATITGGEITGDAAAKGSLTVNGGTLYNLTQNGGTVNVMNGTVGPFTQTAGTANISDTAAVGDAEVAGTFNLKGGTVASLKQTGGTATITGGTVSGKTETSGTVTISNGTFGDFEQKAGTVTISGGKFAEVAVPSGYVYEILAKNLDWQKTEGTSAPVHLYRETGSAALSTKLAKADGTVYSVKSYSHTLSLDPASKALKKDETQAISATTKVNNTDLSANMAYTFTSSDDAIATVDADGTVTMVAESGTATITVTDYYGSATFTVNPTTGGGGGGGGGMSTPTYAITIAEDIENGKVTAEKEKSASGATITLAVAADKGYVLETLTVLDENEEEIELTNNEDGTYTFEMPASEVTVKATFMEDNSMLNFFVDVNKDDYFYDAVLWAAENGITNGIDETHFGPYGATTRAAMVTFLWRAAGSPEPEMTECTFVDVNLDSYYGKAVLWAVENGITKGTSETTFAPFDEVTRAQAVTFLARMAGVKDDDSGYEHSFSDVAAGDYFNNSVAWAAENGITDGTSETTFSPADDCLRCQIVTFLYRYFVE